MCFLHNFIVCGVSARECSKGDFANPVGGWAVSDWVI